MDYRDWGQAEGDPHERRPTRSWTGDDELPVDGAGMPRPGRHDRDREDDTYLPVQRPGDASVAPRRGRHHRDDAPVTPDEPPGRHSVEPNWQQTETTTSWRRVTETRDWRETTSTYGWSVEPDDARPSGWQQGEPMSRGRRRRAAEQRADHYDWSTSAETGSWTSGRQDGATGWTGRQAGTHTGQFDRVVDGDLGEPDRAGNSARPDRPGWSDGRAPTDHPGRTDEAARSGRSTWTDDPGRGDGPSGTATFARYTDDARPSRGPDDTGRSPRGLDDDPGRYGHPANGRRDRSAETGQWSSYTDTGQWDRMTDTGSWAPADDTDDSARSDDRRTGRSRHHREDNFWSGTRLAEDDPRWVDTPATAPRSPAVSFPSPPRSRSDRPGPESAARTGASPAAEPTRSTSGPNGRRPVTRDDGLLDDDPGGAVASVLYTAAWYAVPLLFFFVWMLTLDGSVPAGCATDVDGGGCESARANALTSLLNGAPRFGAALATSLLVAVLLRWASGTWRAVSVGLAAAVVGGGLSTVFLSALSGQPLG